ncbi:MAG: C25 family cysteine peptidase, partial [Planctomycetota bacterium]
IATGDVGCTTLTADDLEEIIIAHDADNTIHIYDHGLSSWTEATTIPSSYETGDGFAVGNVCGDYKDEIIVADISADTIYVYDDAGSEHSFSFVLESGDRIAVGDVHDAGSDEEIIIFMQARDRVEKIRCSMSASGTLTHRHVQWFEYYLHSKDAFIAGDVLTCSRDEILVARGHRANERNVGDIELITSLGGLGPSQERDIFNGLIEEGGRWANKMRRGWASGDYLLIVGETQILPSYNTKFDLYYTEAPRAHHVRITDNHYGDTNGDGVYWPDLAMGRIVGNTAAKLEKPLLWSLGLNDGTYTLDNPLAICASGTDSEDASRFRNTRDSIHDRLTDEGYTSTRVHDPNAHELLDDMTDRTVLFMSGHGNTNVWNDVNSYDVMSLFRPDWARPVVYVASCLTGRYADGYGLAEAFLEHGASMYFGATEGSYTTWSRWLAQEFFDRFIDLGRTAGVSFVQAQRDIIDAGKHWWDRGRNGYTSAIMHLYGDPKLLHSPPAPASMGSTRAAAASMSASVTGPVSTLPLTIPAYVVDDVNGIDYVTIPEGSKLLVSQKPEVPSFSVDVSFPAGYRVQNVTMTSRSGLSTASGLDLPLVEATIGGAVTAASGDQSPDDQWWPDRDFDWTVIEEPNGLTTLRVTAYPFYYKAATTAVEFYQAYDFDIDYISSDKSIIQFKTDKVTYAVDEMVIADLYVMLQEQQGVDLMAEATVKTDGGQVVEGMQIQKMGSVTGLSSCSFQFDSTGFDPDEYIFEAEVKLADGSLVAKKNCQFNIGQSQGLITDLFVQPPCFTVSDNVDITAVFENTGESPITGSLAIEVKDSNSTVVEEFHQDFNDLAVNGANSLNVVWQNAQLGRGDCRIVATVYYGGKTATKSFPDIISDPDLNEDGQVNFNDFAELAQFWQLNYDPADIAPPGGDCIINYYDLQAVLENWLTPVP